jgi:glycerol-3-phosphate dehydrogenase
MGQDTINRACDVASLPKGPSRTLELKIHGWTMDVPEDASEWERVYGSDLPVVRGLSSNGIDLDAPLHPRLPFKVRDVVWSARHEMARTVEDVLARRTRALFLDARASIEAASAVASILAKELGRCDAWKAKELAAFCNLANGYLYQDSDGA